MHTKFNKHFTNEDWKYIKNEIKELRDNYNIYCDSEDADIEAFYIINLIKGGNLEFLKRFIRNCKKMTKFTDDELLNYDNLMRTFPNRIKNEKLQFLCSNIIRQRLSFKPLRKLIRRLLRSVYPMQAEKFYLLKIPTSGKEVSVDWQLKNLVLFLWNNKIKLEGWDQGINDENGFINIDNVSKVKKLFRNVPEIKYNSQTFYFYFMI